MKKTMILSLIIIVATVSAVFSSNKGVFHGMLSYGAVPDTKRVVKLEKPFSFTDTNGKLWLVPAGARVDGASIPQAFWSIIGGPFTGKYREPSVIHDYYCDVKTRSWEDTHYMFYEGMLANGISSSKAKIMYAAVYAGGPRWLKIKHGDKEWKIKGQPRPVADKVIDIINLTKDPSISPKQIREFIDKTLDVDLPEKAGAILSGRKQCSVVVESLETGGSSYTLCGLEADSSKFIALRNLRILTKDIEALLSANNKFLLPIVDHYISNPTKKNWGKVRLASSRILKIVSLTLTSVAQYRNSEDAGEYLKGIQEYLEDRGAIKRAMSPKNVEGLAVAMIT